MAEQINSYCTICGHGYHLCLSCGSHKLTPWRKVTDTSEHYKIHQILSAVSCGVYSKEEAKAKLMNVDLSDIETYKDNVKNRIHEIMGTDIQENKVDKHIDIEDEQIQENISVEEGSVNADMSDAEKPKKSARKKKSTQTVETE